MVDEHSSKAARKKLKFALWLEVPVLCIMYFGLAVVLHRWVLKALISTVAFTLMAAIPVVLPLVARLQILVAKSIDADRLRVLRQAAHDRKWAPLLISHLVLFGLAELCGLYFFIFIKLHYSMWIVSIVGLITIMAGAKIISQSRALFLKLEEMGVEF